MEVEELRELTGTKQDLCCPSSFFLLYGNIPHLDNSGVTWHRHYWRGLYNCSVMIPFPALAWEVGVPQATTQPHPRFCRDTGQFSNLELKSRTLQALKMVQMIPGPKSWGSSEIASSPCPVFCNTHVKSTTQHPVSWGGTPTPLSCQMQRLAKVSLRYSVKLSLRFYLLLHLWFNNCYETLRASLKCW